MVILHLLPSVTLGNALEASLVQSSDVGVATRLKLRRDIKNPL